jgi:hypothetical protein
MRGAFTMMAITGVIVLASILASFTDWLCMDLLVHRFYARTPAVWRRREGSGRIVVSQFIATVATAATVVLCSMMPGHALVIAGAVWFAGPLPVIAQNLQWIGMHPAVACGHAAGWLLRLLIAGALVAMLVPDSKTVTGGPGRSARSTQFLLHSSAATACRTSGISSV